MAWITYEDAMCMYRSALLDIKAATSRELKARCRRTAKAWHSIAIAMASK